MPRRPALRVLRLLPGARLPAYATSGSSGLDLHAATSVLVPAGGRALVPTGLAVAIPPGHEGQVRLRSGLAAKTGLFLPNAPGTIDADYRGEVCVIVANLARRAYRIAAGDRIAQLVIAPVARVAVRKVRRLAATRRGAGGFGHTGR